MYLINIKIFKINFDLPPDNYDKIIEDFMKYRRMNPEDNVNYRVKPYDISIAIKALTNENQKSITYYI